MPAAKSVVYIRNYTADDNTQRTIKGNTYVSASDASFAVPSGMEFVSWNTSRDGTGTAYAVGAAVVATTVYAIWESIPDPVPYITTDTELTSVANAIRTKGGTSAQLVYPTGFVSAIEAIPTGGGGGAWQDISSLFQLYDSQHNLISNGVTIAAFSYGDFVTLCIAVSASTANSIGDDGANIRISDWHYWPSLNDAWQGSDTQQCGVSIVYDGIQGQYLPFGLVLMNDEYSPVDTYSFSSTEETAYIIAAYPTT